MFKTISSILLIGIFLVGCSPSTQAEYSKDVNKEITENGQLLPIEATVTIDNTLIELEVAKTQEQQQIGLMYRQFLDKNRGMIFVFEELRPLRFWMKNGPDGLANQVIELPGGRAKELGIEPGDQLEIEFTEKTSFNP